MKNISLYIQEDKVHRYILKLMTLIPKVLFVLSIGGRMVIRSNGISNRVRPLGVSAISAPDNLPSGLTRPKTNTSDPENKFLKLLDVVFST